jgi:hypothetical protein
VSVGRQLVQRQEGRQVKASGEVGRQVKNVRLHEWRWTSEGRTQTESQIKKMLVN